MKPLPRGRHGLSREFIAEHQRERLLAAIADSLDEHGYDGTTVSAIAGRAGVSKSDFYRHFDSKDECFFAAYDEAVERLRADVVGACAGEGEWALGVCAGLGAALAGLTAEPGQANLLLVEGLPAAGSTTATRRRSRASSRICAIALRREPVPAGRRGRPTRRWSAASPRCSAAACLPVKRPASSDSSRNLPSLR